MRHFWGILLLVALIASFVVSDRQSHVRDRAQHTQLVQGCERNSQRIALVAAYQHRTAAARRAVGGVANVQAGNDYDAFANGLEDLIPVPKGVAPGDSRIVKVVRAPLNRPPGAKFVLSREAVVLQAAGCELTYP